MKMFTITMLTLLSLSAMAQNADKATEQEKKLLCNSLQTALEESESDVGVDLAACLKNKSIKSTLLQEGVREVSGKIQLSYASIGCKITYEVTPVKENVLSPVSCE